MASKDPIKPNPQIEDETSNHIIQMENAFRDYYATLVKEMKSQRDLLERMWVLSQRYITYDSAGPCWKFSEVYTAPTDESILQEYHDKMQLVRTSNLRLSNGLRVLRKSLQEFRGLCSQLDMGSQSPLIVGDAFHKPLAYFVELFDDCFKYMHALVLNFKAHSHLMDPVDPTQLEGYKKILAFNENFDQYLLHGLVYCKCLRPKSKSCESKTPKVGK